MKKKRIKANNILHFVVVLAFIAPWFGKTTAKAYASENTREDFSLIDENIDGVISDFSQKIPDGMEDFTDPNTSSDAVGLAFLIESIIVTFNSQSGAFISFFVSLFGMMILMSFASLQEGEMGRSAKNAVFLVTSAIIVDKVFVILDSIGESLGEINNFFSSMIPIVAAVNTLGISPSVATAQSLGMSLTLQIYSFISGSFLYSFIGIMLVLSSLSALDRGSFGKINATVRKAFLVIMGALTVFVGATFSLQSLISSSADSWKVRGAKYAVSGMIPIVGGSISSALSTLSGGVEYLRGVVGGGAVAVIVATAVAPLVSLIIYRCCFNVVILFSGICSNDGVEQTLGGFVSVFDALIATYSLTVTIYIIQLTVFLKGGANFV